MLVIDEVAVSDVARTEWEIRRDACVPLPPEPFGPAPSELGSHLAGTPFDLDDIKWPDGLAYSSKVQALGKLLFESTTLSDPTNGAGRSCSSCHQPPSFATSGEVVAVSVDGMTPLLHNTPTLLNAGLGTLKGFSGASADLEAQSILPLDKFEEMGNDDIADVIIRLNVDPNGENWPAEFDDAFGNTNVGATEEYLEQALAMYIRTLYSGETGFDFGTLGPQQAHGMALFFGKARCASCHVGHGMTDGDFHNIGSIATTSHIKDRSDETGRTTDVGALKTPTLRQLGLTANYFHDGAKANLDSVVDHYEDPNLASDFKGTLDRKIRPLNLSGDEVNALLAFLNAL